jgi:hypothetical protein
MLGEFEYLLISAAAGLGKEGYGAAYPAGNRDDHRPQMLDWRALYHH